MSEDKMKINIGRVQPQYCGEWDSSKEYHKLDHILYNGSTYVALKTVPYGVAPLSGRDQNEHYWQLIASQGEQGPKGDKGDESAYDAAVEGGYTGTEEEFNATLGKIDTALYASDVDAEMLSSSTNPVQNKVVTAAMDGKAPVIYDTASGAVVSFQDGADTMPLKSLVVNIEPLQSGSGDPSPENIRPISGWTGCTVLKYSESSVSPDQVLQGRIQSAGEFSTNTTTRCATQDFIPAEPGTTYTVAVNAGVQCIAAHYYASADAGSWISRDALVGQVSTFTTPENCAYIRFMYAKNDTNETISPAEITATVVAVAPALVELSFPTKAGTVYYGTIDIISGVLSARAAIFDMGDLTYTETTGGIRFDINGGVGAGAQGAPAAFAMCSAYKLYADTIQSISQITLPNNCIVQTTAAGARARYYIRDDRYTTAAAMKAGLSGVQFLCELREPNPYQLTPQQVNTLIGVNNIWADCGPVSVEYPVDTKSAIDKQAADIDDLKNAFDDLFASFPYKIPHTFVSGNITTAGGTTSTPTRIRSSSTVKVEPGMYVEVLSPYKATIAIYNASNMSTSNFVGFLGGNESSNPFYDGPFYIPNSLVNKYIAIRIQNSNTPDSDISSEVANIGNYVKLYSISDEAVNYTEVSKRPKIASYDGGTLLANQTGNTIARVSTFAEITDAPDDLLMKNNRGWVVTFGTVNKMQMLYSGIGKRSYHRFYDASTQTWSAWNSFPLDTTLTTAGAAADAKTVGDLFEEAETVISSRFPSMFSNMFIWEYSRGISNAGTDIKHAGVARTTHFTVSEGDVFIGRAIPTNPNGVALTLYICTYKNGVFDKRTQLDAGVRYVVPSGVTTIRFSFGYAMSSGLTLTRYEVSEYFKVQYSDWYYNWRVTDRPNLVAFGASTTDATIHHYDGMDYTKAEVMWPEYTASALNLRCINLGIGSTGFLSRSGGDKNNFMDQIFANPEALAAASVVVLMFGYGNDSAAGLPIGVYTDYYPYDAEGYHPSGAEGVTTMLSKGVTLMGALNWCIKWINEHYPMAQVIPVFGAPSANKDRSITMTAQTEGAGVAPYTLNFSDPYGESGTTTNKRIKQISEELQKLKAALNIPIVDMFFDGAAFSWWSTYATRPVEIEGQDYTEYALFSTTGTPASPIWNSHPNKDGYLAYSRMIAARVAALAQYRY